ncbi:hypothetical protein AA313_de0209594 [Arthrobotrys entomopaga]|nr:hypothetical protein AA313_de0209594 [Arthrobotrys entomopaga]
MSVATATILSTGQTIQDLVALANLRDLTGPTEQYPPGWLPPALLDKNYVPPVRLGAAHLYSGAITLAISILLVTWKVVTTQRTRTRRLLFLEDWMLLLALAGHVTYMALIWFLCYHQAGWHFYDVKYQNALDLYKYAGVANVTLIWVYCTSRVSLLISIRRMYSPIQTRLKCLIDLFIFGECIAFFICTFCFIFARPEHPETPFNLVAALKYSASTLKINIRLMAVQVAFDSIILFFPFPLLWKLRNLPRGRKVLITAFCSLGVLTLAAGYSRLAYVVSVKGAMFYDFTWYLPPVGIFNNIEIFLFMITACLPTANLFFKWAYNKNRIPTGVPRLARIAMMKRDKTRNQCSTVDTDDTYDPDWSQSGTLRSELSYPIPTKARMRLGLEDHPVELSHISQSSQPLPIVEKDIKPASIEIRRTPSYTNNIRDMSQPSWPLPTRLSIVSLGEGNSGEEEEEEEEEDNFYEMLVPSDGFFPSGTALRPRPAVRIP